MTASLSVPDPAFLPPLLVQRYFVHLDKEFSCLSRVLIVSADDLQQVPEPMKRQLGIVTNVERPGDLTSDDTPLMFGSVFYGQPLQSRRIDQMRQRLKRCPHHISAATHT